MNVPIPETIVQAVERNFLKKNQAEALAVLGEYASDDPAVRERVLHCAISLAGRRLDRLKHFLDCAREDHRNLILWHEHPEASRKEFFKD